MARYLMAFQLIARLLRTFVFVNEVAEFESIVFSQFALFASDTVLALWIQAYRVLVRDLVSFDFCDWRAEQFLLGVSPRNRFLKSWKLTVYDDWLGDVSFQAIDSTLVLAVISRVVVLEWVETWDIVFWENVVWKVAASLTRILSLEMNLFWPTFSVEILVCLWYL